MLVATDFHKPCFLFDTFYTKCVVNINAVIHVTHSESHQCVQMTTFLENPTAQSPELANNLLTFCQGGVNYVLIQTLSQIKIIMTIIPYVGIYVLIWVCIIALNYLTGLEHFWQITFSGQPRQGTGQAYRAFTLSKWIYDLFNMIALGQNI